MSYFQHMANRSGKASGPSATSPAATQGQRASTAAFRPSSSSTSRPSSSPSSTTPSGRTATASQSSTTTTNATNSNRSSTPSSSSAFQSLRDERPSSKRRDANGKKIPTHPSAKARVGGAGSDVVITASPPPKGPKKSSAAFVNDISPSSSAPSTSPTKKPIQHHLGSLLPRKVPPTAGGTTAAAPSPSSIQSKAPTVALGLSSSSTADVKPLAPPQAASGAPPMSATKRRQRSIFDDDDEADLANGGGRAAPHADTRPPSADVSPRTSFGGAAAVVAGTEVKVGAKRPRGKAAADGAPLSNNKGLATASTSAPMFAGDDGEAGGPASTSNMTRQPSSGSWLSALGISGGAQQGSPSGGDGANLLPIASRTDAEGSVANANSRPQPSSKGSGAQKPLSLAALLENLEGLGATSSSGGILGGGGGATSSGTLPPSSPLVTAPSSAATWSPHVTPAPMSPSRVSVSPTRSSSFARGVANFLATTARSVATAIFSPSRSQSRQGSDDDESGSDTDEPNNSVSDVDDDDEVTVATLKQTMASPNRRKGRAVRVSADNHLRGSGSTAAGSTGPSSPTGGRVVTRIHKNLFADDDEDDVAISHLRIKKGNTMTISRRGSSIGSNASNPSSPCSSFGGSFSGSGFDQLLAASGGASLSAVEADGHLSPRTNAGGATASSSGDGVGADALWSPDPRLSSAAGVSIDDAPATSRGLRLEGSGARVSGSAAALSKVPPPLPPPAVNMSAAAASTGRRTLLLSPPQLIPFDRDGELAWLQRANEYLFELLPQEVKEENFDDSAVPNPNPQGLMSAEMQDDVLGGTGSSGSLGGGGATNSPTSGERFVVKVGVDLYKRIFATLDRFTADADDEGCRAVSQLVDTLLKMRVKRVHASLLTTYLGQTVEALKYAYPALGDPTHYKLGPQRRHVLPPSIPITIPPALAESVERSQRIEDLLNVLVAPCDEVSFVGVASHQQRLLEGIAESLLSTRFYSHLVQTIRALKPSSGAVRDDGAPEGYDGTSPVFEFPPSYCPPQAANGGSPSMAGRSSRVSGLLMLSPDVRSVNGRASGITSGGFSQSPTSRQGPAPFGAAKADAPLSPNQAAQLLWRTFYECTELLLTHHPSVGVVLHALRADKVVGLLCQGLVVRYDDWAADGTTSGASAARPTIRVGGGVASATPGTAKKRGRSVSPATTVPPALATAAPAPPVPACHPRLCAMLANRIMQLNTTLSQHFATQVAAYNEVAWNCLLPPLYLIASDGDGGGGVGSATSAVADTALQQEMLEAIFCIVSEGGDAIKESLFRDPSIGVCSGSAAPEAGGGRGSGRGGKNSPSLGASDAGGRTSTGGRKSGSAPKSRRNGLGGAGSDDSCDGGFGPSAGDAGASAHATAMLPVTHFSIGILTAANPMPLLGVASCLLEPREKSDRYGDHYLSFHFAVLVAVHNRLLDACGLALPPVAEPVEALIVTSVPPPPRKGSKGASASPAVSAAKGSPKASPPTAGKRSPKHRSAADATKSPQPAAAVAPPSPSPALTLYRRSPSPARGPPKLTLGEGTTPLAKGARGRSGSSPLKGPATTTSAKGAPMGTDDQRRQALARIRANADLLLHLCKYVRNVVKADASLLTLSLQPIGSGADGPSRRGSRSSMPSPLSRGGSTPSAGFSPQRGPAPSVPRDDGAALNDIDGGAAVPLLEGMLEALVHTMARVRKQGLLYGRVAEVVGLLRQVRDGELE